MPTQCLTNPQLADEPISLADLAAHLRRDITAEQDYLATLISAARADAEAIMGWPVCSSQFLQTEIGWADGIALSMQPVQSVQTVKYLDATGTEQTLAGTEWRLQSANSKIVPAFGKTWPATLVADDAVRVTYTAGYANPASVPAPIKQWIKLRAAAFDLYREAWTEGRPIQKNEFIDRLLDAYKNWSI